MSSYSPRAYSGSDRRWAFFYFGPTSGTANIYQREPHVQTSNCDKKSLLTAIFSNNSFQYGRSGSTTPGLIWGDCPMSAAIIKVRDTPSVFGPTGTP